MKSDDCVSLALKFIQGTSDPLLIWKCLNKLLTYGNLDLETELQPLILAAVSLDNSELTSAIGESETILNALDSWADLEMDWDSFASFGLSLDDDGDLIIEFESTQMEYTMGTQLETHIKRDY